MGINFYMEFGIKYKSFLVTFNFVWDYQSSYKLCQWKPNVRSHHLDLSYRLTPHLSTTVELINSHDVALVLAGYNDGNIQVWSQGRDGPPKLISGWHALPICKSPSFESSSMAMQWDQRSCHLICAGDSRVIKIWDIESETKLTALSVGVNDPVTTMYMQSKVPSKVGRPSRTIDSDYEDLRSPQAAMSDRVKMLKHVTVAAVSSEAVSKLVGLVSLSLASIVIDETIQLIKRYFWRNYVTELEVPNTDKSYNWLLQWISKHNQQLLHFSVTTVCRNTESAHATSKFDYEPSAGEHVFKYKGHTISVKRDRSTVLSSEYGSRPFETLNLSTWGRNRQVLNEILNEARSYAMSIMESGTTLMVPSYDTWHNFGEPRVPRSLSSVILDEGVIENILKDIHNFVDDKSWYLDRGIPYRRGYLLYGPPGCGKTSLIMALAGDIKYNLCVLSLNDSKMSDDQLVQLMGEVPSKSFVLLEDIDAMFANRDGKTVIEGSTKVTLSGLLNALDGVVSSEGRILFMTTNYVDRLDTALIRSGRVDFKQYIGTCSDHQLSEMFTRFRPEGTEDDKKRFVKDIRKYNKPVIPAHLQEFFLVHRHKELNYVFEHINDLWQNVQDIQLTE